MLQKGTIKLTTTVGMFESLILCFFSTQVRVANTKTNKSSSIYGTESCVVSLTSKYFYYNFTYNDPFLSVLILSFYTFVSVSQKKEFSQAMQMGLLCATFLKMKEQETLRYWQLPPVIKANGHTILVNSTKQNNKM